MGNVLNPVLYAALKTRFGDIIVASRGAQANVTPMPGGDSEPNMAVNGGEYYRVNCPECSDKDHTLWVSYLFGTKPINSEKQLLHVATCYRCQSSGGDAKARAELRLAVIPSFSNARMAIEHTTAETLPPLERKNMPEGLFAGVSTLGAAHPLTVYLRSRNFDPEQMYKQHRWLYCHSSENDFLARRLFIPVFHRFEDGLGLAGYQSRVIPGLSVREGPKYWTMPGFQRSRVLYNMHNAVQQPMIVIVEGITDVARVGLCAVALLGKSLSATQRQILTAADSQVRIAVLLDSDAKAAARTLVRSLTTSTLAQPSNRVVFNVALPTGDPGDYTTEELHQFINEAGSEYC